MTGVEVLVAVGIAVGLVGVVVPLLLTSTLLAAVVWIIGVTIT